MADCASGSFHGNSSFFSVAAPSLCKRLVEPQELLAASFYFETILSPAGRESKMKGCEIKPPVQRARAARARARHSETRHGNCAGEKSSRAGLGLLTTHGTGHTRGWLCPGTVTCWGRATVALTGPMSGDNKGTNNDLSCPAPLVHPISCVPMSLYPLLSAEHLCPPALRHCQGVWASPGLSCSGG